MSLAEIFALHGEAGFHRFEGEALERFCPRENAWFWPSEALW
jgi:shikimate kinase